MNKLLFYNSGSSIDLKNFDNNKRLRNPLIWFPIYQSPIVSHYCLILYYCTFEVINLLQGWKKCNHIESHLCSAWGTQVHILLCANCSLCVGYLCTVYESITTFAHSTMWAFDSATQTKVFFSRNKLSFFYNR